MPSTASLHGLLLHIASAPRADKFVAVASHAMRNGSCHIVSRWRCGIPYSRVPPLVVSTTGVAIIHGLRDHVTVRELHVSILVLLLLLLLLMVENQNVSMNNLPNITGLCLSSNMNG
jgi:phosphate/sulfate permease